MQRARRVLFGVDATVAHDGTISVADLSRRLHALDIGIPAVNVPMINASLKELVVELYGNVHHSGCPHDDLDEAGSLSQQGGDPFQRRADALKRQLGTVQAPFRPQLENGCIPINEFAAHGYETLAFPTLFPFGRGYYAESRKHKLEFRQYSKHLTHYHDGRFAVHARFPYFLLNTHERQLANRLAEIAISDMAENATVQDIRQLSQQDRKAQAKHISKYTASLRNSPGFFDKRKKELTAMCEQLGDPHAFATHSHADTYCPYLARFIMTWACLPEGGSSDPAEDGLSVTQRYQRRQALVVKYPHLTALFFHLKTELYLEHVCVGIMGADAWWSRYEWQSRGSTHAHYFLWFRDAPDVSFLEDWLQQALADANQGAPLDDCNVDAIVESLNERALAASAASENEQDRMAAAATEYWSTRCSRWNNAWLNDRNEPDDVGWPHPAEQLCVPCRPATPGAPREISAGADRWLGRLLNAANRHDQHTDYCLRKDKHGKSFCRFHFPQQPRDENERVHFYSERIDDSEGSARGIRWRLYLPMNDPLRNSVNHWQALANRSNVDFQPLVDHMAALEYMTKYATKAEKGSGSFESVLNSVVSRSEEQLPSDASARRVYAAVLSQTVGGRNWSAQEVGHVNIGCPTVVSSHKFETVYLAGKRRCVRVWPYACLTFPFPNAPVPAVRPQAFAR